MDIVRFKGGLGNQMFQYAFVEALRDQGREVKSNLGYYRRNLNAMPFCLNEVFPLIDLNEVDDDVFYKINCEWAKIKNDQSKLTEFLSDTKNRFFWVEGSEEYSRYIKEVFNTTNCTFVGYWQTGKYFKNIEKKIREKYTFKNISEELKQFSAQLKNNYYGVHIRRNDYLNCALYENICTKDYYMKAINYIRILNKKAKFIFFSDDIEWVKQNLYMEDALYDVRNKFVDYKDWYDMYLMTQCCGNIIANSSFSWWGAWLNNYSSKIVIAPKKWTNIYEMPDIWCESWIRM